MSIERWVALFRGVPFDLLTTELTAWIAADDSERLLAFSEAKCQEAIDEERAFLDQHPEARELAKVTLRSLTKPEHAQIEWFRHELLQRQERTQLLLRCLRDARDIVWLESSANPESDDNEPPMNTSGLAAILSCQAVACAMCEEVTAADWVAEAFVLL